MRRELKLPFCRLLVCAGAVLAMMARCRAAEASLADCIDATCRISAPDGSRGTGCAFEKSQGYVFVLTAAHVVGGHGSVECEFWRQGHQSIPLTAKVIVRSQTIDAAVVSLPLSAFGGLAPTCVPIAPQDYRLAEGDTVTSVGCASGAWATGWKGHVLGYANLSLCFMPPPADGRSGSALFDARGEKIVGLIWGRQDEERRGYAVTVENLYRGLNFRQTGSGWVHRPLPLLTVVEPSQCGPGGCTPGQLLPYRRYQEQRQQDRDRRLDQLDLDLRLRPGGGIWPTLPPQAQPPQTQPPPPNLDLEVDRKTEREAEARRPESGQGVTGLGVGVALAAAMGVGVFLFYVVGKQ